MLVTLGSLYHREMIVNLLRLLSIENSSHLDDLEWLLTRSYCPVPGLFSTEPGILAIDWSNFFSSPCSLTTKWPFSVDLKEECCFFVSIFPDTFPALFFHNKWGKKQKQCPHSLRWFHEKHSTFLSWQEKYQIYICIGSSYPCSKDCKFLLHFCLVGWW